MMSSPSRGNSSCSLRHESRQGSWEEGQGEEPEQQEGVLLKKRKWPLKGWHKRYFLLDKGFLKYGKSEADMLRGRFQGCIDVGLSVMAIKKRTQCIDLDTEEYIFHLKIRSQEVFEEWVSKLRRHRLYRQNEIATYPHERPPTPKPAETANLRQSSIHPVTSSTWLKSSHLDKCSKEISVCESYLLELSHLLKNMEVLHRTNSAPAISTLQASNFNSPKRDKRVPRMTKWLPKSSSKETKTSLQVPTSVSMHTSSPLLSPSELPGPDAPLQTPHSPTDTPSIQEHFCRVANHLHLAMSSAFSMLASEQDRLEQALEPGPTPSPAPASARAFEVADGRHPLVHQASSESGASVPESLSEFFDAQEVLLSSSSSENEASDDDSYASDVSDSVSMETFSSEPEREGPKSGCEENSAPSWRRSCLPAVSSSCSSVSMWNILRKNIGKDLSRVPMPVQLNQPINTLQRLCEELEYCHLLESAANTRDPLQRMLYIATFVVSGYASSFHRAGGKPFNPVLGETFECDRPDRGFRFIAEQVSHHPPISACHAQSKDFVFWQDVRWRNKFWGKSMEIIPVGTTHVLLPEFGDHYEWNKVTSCIHNILCGQRWMEHYGDIIIKNRNSNTCQARVTFLKGKPGGVNTVEGVVSDGAGRVQLFGKWNEGLYCGAPPTCIWRANAMPVDYQQYYGFTQFALELNELDAALRPLLPPTDTRFRPDQRLLEEGSVEQAEDQKQRIEQLQRDRREVLEENSMTHLPRFFRKSEEGSWVSNNTYWELRNDPGFSHLDSPVLW